MHTGTNNVVRASIVSGGTGGIDMDITGGVVYGGSATAHLINLSGRTGADSVTVGRGAAVCRGTYSAGSCTAGGGRAVYLGKTGGGTSGTVTFTNAGRVWGNVAAPTGTCG